jgi:hypothetical protein
MASFTLTEGTNVGPAPGGPVPPSTAAQTEKALAQVLVNDHMRTGKCGLTVTYVYDDAAHTLTATFAGTAS